MKPSAAERRRVATMLSSGMRMVKQLEPATGFDYQFATVTTSVSGETVAKLSAVQNEDLLQKWNREREDGKRTLELVAAERDPATARQLKHFDAARERTTSLVADFQPGSFAEQTWWPSPGNYTIDAWRQDKLADYRAIVSSAVLEANQAIFAYNGVRKTATESIGVHETVEVALVDAEPQLEPKVERLSVPPTNACYVLSLVLPPRDRQVIVGDLVEEYRSYMVPEFGERRARIWFWTQTARSVFAGVPKRLMSFIAGAGTMKAITTVWHRIIGS